MLTVGWRVMLAEAPEGPHLITTYLLYRCAPDNIDSYHTRLVSYQNAIAAKTSVGAKSRWARSKLPQMPKTNLPRN